MEEKKFKLAYFFLYRLCKVIINRYKQTKTTNTWTDKSISFFKKLNYKKKILRHHKRTLSNAIIVLCTKICVKE